MIMQDFSTDYSNENKPLCLVKKELASWHTITLTLTAAVLYIIGVQEIFPVLLLVLTVINIQRQCRKCENRCY